MPSQNKVIVHEFILHCFVIFVKSVTWFTFKAEIKTGNVDFL